MKAYATLDEFILDLPALAAPLRDRLRGQDGLFLVSTKQGRQLSIRLEDGVVTLPENPSDKPVCTLSADESTLLRLLSGSLSPVKALLLRKVIIQGDAGRLKALISLMSEAAPL